MKPGQVEHLYNGSVCDGTTLVGIIAGDLSEVAFELGTNRGTKIEATFADGLLLNLVMN